MTWTWTLLGPLSGCDCISGFAYFSFNYLFILLILNGMLPFFEVLALFWSCFYSFWYFLQQSDLLNIFLKIIFSDRRETFWSDDDPQCFWQFHEIKATKRKVDLMRKCENVAVENKNNPSHFITIDLEEINVYILMLMLKFKLYFVLSRHSKYDWYIGRVFWFFISIRISG